MQNSFGMEQAKATSVRKHFRLAIISIFLITFGTEGLDKYLLISSFEHAFIHVILEAALRRGMTKFSRKLLYVMPIGV